MPQLARMATTSGAVLYFRWPYHAKVMKMFEHSSKSTGMKRSMVMGMAASIW